MEQTKNSTLRGVSLRKDSKLSLLIFFIKKEIKGSKGNYISFHGNTHHSSGIITKSYITENAQRKICGRSLENEP